MEDLKEILEETIEDNVEVADKILPKESEIKEKEHKPKNQFKTKQCRVISYDKRTGNLDVDFDGYGIRIKNVKDFNGNIAEIKYKGQIGKSNFSYKL